MVVGAKIQQIASINKHNKSWNNSMAGCLLRLFMQSLLELIKLVLL
jgi:hypothetical protein